LFGAYTTAESGTIRYPGIHRTGAGGPPTARESRIFRIDRRSRPANLAQPERMV